MALVRFAQAFHIVMAGLVPAIHDLSRGKKNVDARDKPGHDEFVAGVPTKQFASHRALGRWKFARG